MAHSWDSIAHELAIITARKELRDAVSAVIAAKEKLAALGKPVSEEPGEWPGPVAHPWPQAGPVPKSPKYRPYNGEEDDEDEMPVYR